MSSQQKFYRLQNDFTRKNYGWTDELNVSYKSQFHDAHILII